MLELRQLFDNKSSTYTYLVWDSITRDAALIDPVLNLAGRDLNLISELELKLKYVLETHIHADHITGSGRLRDITSAQVIVHFNSHSKCADWLVHEGDQIDLGNHAINVIHTPGHTSTDVCYQIEGAIFTGDALHIRGCGRTDFQSGDAGQLYDSITQKLFTLPDETIVYPGHDYKGLSSSSIGEEKAYNLRLGGNRNRNAFIFIMESLNLEPPENMKQAVPENLRCGLKTALNLAN